MSKNQDGLPQALENQFILRLPPEHASAVRKIIRSGSAAARAKLKIDLSPDARRATVQVDDVSLSARVVDLPCVIESLKTHDRKTFYKTADVCQMLLCSSASEGDAHSSQEEPATSAAAAAVVGSEREAEGKYTWKHGITPPLKNVRKKRFRKPTQKPPDMKHGEESGSGYIDSKDVEKEVKRLLRSDAEAISSRWEVIVDDETKADRSQTCTPQLPLPSEVGGHTSAACAMPQSTFSDSSSEVEDEEDEEAEEEGEAEEEEEEEEMEEEEEDDSEEDLERDLQAKFMEFSLCKANESSSSIILGMQKLIHSKERKLQEIQGKAQRQKDLLRKLENLTLKSHFQSVLEQLKLQEKQKYEQILFLQEQLKYFLKK
ncbi:transcription initiation factor TFIID subunit 7-like isoform X2 [Apodemus sylvaticus]|uniref:transcription initiation factor TFIID subunit 7-like isoform X2 n=1 Tax=Apodemus sylvaticus TaxID=10129 RepID=UPI0022448693|nr:transcription initiation factor TFIID subunit 7-like isoform X2 [Apodemus sylvaticus]